VHKEISECFYAEGLPPPDDLNTSQGQGKLKFMIETRPPMSEPTMGQKLSGLIPMVILFTIQGFMYHAYVLWHLILMFERSGTGLTMEFWKADKEYGLALFEYMFFHVFTINLLISILRTMFTSPGNIPDTYALEIESKNP
jgi:hypothetical protein